MPEAQTLMTGIVFGEQPRWRSLLSGGGSVSSSVQAGDLVDT
jgi:hypothetical protein